ncbi:hypothetical protein, partial [Xanthomonas hortorum]|uniref:hypothetical protein n=1 Tax=Xanthomonas hortorum TaxID=56454 RepID=UPI001F290448
EDLPASLLALAQALSVTERQLHGSLLNMGVVSLICGALFRGSLGITRYFCDKQSTKLLRQDVTYRGLNRRRSCPTQGEGKS